MNNITHHLTIEFTDYLSRDYDSNFSANLNNLSKEFTCQREQNMLLYENVVQTLVYSMVFLLGVIGNGLLLMVLLQRRAHLRMTEIYLLHLALSDLLLLFTLPFGVTQMLAGWVFGNFLCKLVGLLHYLNFVCGSLLLAGICFDRYLAIVHVVSSFQIRRPQTVHLICAVLWLFSLVVSMPNIAFLSVEPLSNDPTWLECYFNHHGIHAHNWLLVSHFLTHLLCFLLPLIIMGYCYSAVVVKLFQSKKSLEKQGAIRLALVITVVFCLCWLPYNVTLLVDTLLRLKILSLETCQSNNAVNLSLKITESIGFIHCCLNPILYAFIGVRFRNDLLKLLAKYFPVCWSTLCGRCLTNVSGTEMATTTTTTSQFI